MPVIGKLLRRNSGSSESSKSQNDQLVDLVVEDDQAEAIERVRARKEGGPGWNEVEQKHFVQTYDQGQKEEVREGFNPDVAKGGDEMNMRKYWWNAMCFLALTVAQTMWMNRLLWVTMRRPWSWILKTNLGMINRGTRGAIQSTMGSMKNEMPGMGKMQANDAFHFLYSLGRLYRYHFASDAAVRHFDNQC